MATLRFELVAPERILFSGDVEAVMLPASEGDMTVLPGHAPVVTTLKTGFVVMNGTGDRGSRVFVRGGFAEINAAGVTVLAERATPIEELTPERLDQEIADALTLRDTTDDDEAKDVANSAVAQLEEAKAALRL